MTYFASAPSREHEADPESEVEGGYQICRVRDARGQRHRTNPPFGMHATLHYELGDQRCGTDDTAVRWCSFSEYVLSVETANNVHLVLYTGRAKARVDRRGSSLARAVIKGHRRIDLPPASGAEEETTVSLLKRDARHN